MNAYNALAQDYDALTEDIPYAALADWYQAALTRKGGAVSTLLDLGCGTGTLTMMMAQRGFEMIGTDASAEMLARFQQKIYDLPKGVIRPLLLCQRSEELDLYGTVDGAYCSLDGMNYLPGEALGEVFRRLRLFIAPGGILAFDFFSEERMKSLDGQCFVDEREGLLCLWRAAYENGVLRYGLDIFTEDEDGLWEREQEEHTEYVHPVETLKALLEENGFGNIELYTNGPQCEQGRLYLTAERM